jgi:Ca-activated chloride channel family protein
VNIRLIVAGLLVLAVPACASTGVLLPMNKQAPDASILSLEEMSVDVAIDNGDARVFITQIFLNHTGSVEEGTYNFPLPGGASISDFAVWDGPVRIPAVVLERRRAQQVYDQARQQAIDPGLLQMGERAGADPGETSLFSAKILPIPAYGTKRLEIEYHQRLEATAFAGGFVLPLKPDAAGEQRVHRFTAHITLHSALALSRLQLGAGYKFNIEQQDGHTLVADFSAEDLALTDDLSASWTFDPAGADTLDVIAHRDPRTAAIPPDETSAPSGKPKPEPGFFEATALVGESHAGPSENGPPRTVIVLFDNSLSMQWEKLERSYGAAEALLRSLRPVDRFNVLLFNQQMASFAPQPQAADAQHIAQALEFIRSSRLRGGTDLGRALAAGLAQTEAGTNSVLAVLTDGDSDRGETVLTRSIAARYTKQWKALAHPPHTDILAVGDDANLGLLRLLAKNEGFMEHVLSTEPLELHLHAFLSKMTRSPVVGLALDASPGRATQMVYPLEESVYTGSTAGWVGQYAQAAGVSLTVHGVRSGEPFALSAKARLPAEELDHPQLPRLWAQARVDALLAQINRDGESRAAIDEIIRLARRYKLVTPYTSFLAVPRSLLRPRVIRPGDPVLRVRTDPAIESVVAIFPFGLTKELRHLASEDTPDDAAAGGRLWETRFLAPADMHDGTYSVRLILRDRSGNTYREAKTFVIASTPPAVRILLPGRRLHRGQTVLLRATASESTRTLTARLEGAAAVSLRWNAAAGANAGALTIPADMAIGTYKLSVTAEDIAHNLGSEEVTVEVVP